MTTIKEIVVQSIGEPAFVEFEKNSKNENYKVNYHGEDMDQVLDVVLAARRRVRKELNYPDDEVKDENK